jgi:hypothetical protein
VQKKPQKKEYDTVLRGRAYTGLGLRVLVAGYMVYLAWKLLSNMLGGKGSIPEWGVYAICVVFAAAAVGFCVYAWKGFRKALKAAELTPAPETITESSEETDSPEEGTNNH